MGLALGGGAARGLAHLGVLEVLEEAHIPIDLIAGTSFGALCGGVYAHTLRAEALLSQTRSFITSDLYRGLTVHLFHTPKAPSFLDGVWRAIRKGITLGGGLRRLSFIGDEEYRSVIDALIPDLAIEELSIPFAATAVDLLSTEEVVFRRGSLRKAVMASAAIPGLFPPQAYKDMLLVDGSWADCVPVEPARELGADIVIAVDVAPDAEETAELRMGLEVAWLANSITRSILKRRQLKGADVLITPRVESIHWADFSVLEAARELGREAALRALPQIQELLKVPEKKRSWWRRSRG